MSHLQTSGHKILRVWGFNDVNSTPGSGTVWYQSLSGSTPTINTGANGLQRLDYVVKSAEAHGIKLIINFVNNWDDYGGIKAYTNCRSSFYRPSAFLNIKFVSKAYVVQTCLSDAKPSPVLMIQRMLMLVIGQFMAAHTRVGTRTLLRRRSTEPISRPLSAAMSQALRSLPGN